jgi:hypothetical protein
VASSKVPKENRLHRRAIAKWHAGQLGEAALLLEQALDGLTAERGSNHPATLAAKGDLAAVLYEGGLTDQAEALEREAFECARMHLGKTHSVTSVLAWNRALNCESRGDFESARKFLADELSWLLAEDPVRLDGDQSMVRAMLAARWNWDSAAAC